MVASMRALAAVALMGAGTEILLAQPPGDGWEPPREGAAAMFRKMDRAFAVGGRSGGAGGELGRESRVGGAGDVAAGGAPFTFELAPLDSWDSRESPLGQLLPAGSIRLYRPGTYTPEITGAAGEAVRVPPGEWFLVGEAPGQVTAFSPKVAVGVGQEDGGSLVVPVVPACRLELPEGSVGAEIERVDVVSLAEAAVYPLVPAVQPAANVPAGSFLVYAVRRDGRIAAVGDVESCEAGQRREISLPSPPPAGGRWSLVVRVELPRGEGGEHRITGLVAGTEGARAKPVENPITLRQGRRLFVILDDLPVGELELTLEGTSEEPHRRQWEPVPGEVVEAVWRLGT